MLGDLREVASRLEAIEKLLRDEMKAQRDAVQRLERTVYGNSRPGLVARVQVLWMSTYGLWAVVGLVVGEVVVRWLFGF